MKTGREGSGRKMGGRSVSVLGCRGGERKVSTTTQLDNGRIGREDGGEEFDHKEDG